MSTTAPRKKGTDHDRLRHFYLGRDGEGDYHHYSRQTGRVYTITPTGEIAFADPLETPATVGRPEAERIDIYREYVADERGQWAETVILPIFGQRVGGDQ